MCTTFLITTVAKVGDDVNGFSLFFSGCIDPKCMRGMTCAHSPAFPTFFFGADTHSPRVYTTFLTQGRHAILSDDVNYMHDFRELAIWPERACEASHGHILQLERIFFFW